MWFCTWAKWSLNLESKKNLLSLKRSFTVHFSAQQTLQVVVIWREFRDEEVLECLAWLFQPRRQLHHILIAQDREHRTLLLYSSAFQAPPRKKVKPRGPPSFDCGRTLDLYEGGLHAVTQLGGAYGGSSPFLALRPSTLSSQLISL